MSQTLTARDVLVPLLSGVGRGCSLAEAARRHDWLGLDRGLDPFGAIDESLAEFLFRVPALWGHPSSSGGDAHGSTGGAS